MIYLTYFFLILLSFSVSTILAFAWVVVCNIDNLDARREQTTKEAFATGLAIIVFVISFGCVMWAGHQHIMERMYVGVL